MLNNALTLNPFKDTKVKSVELIQNPEADHVQTFPAIKICPDCPDTDPVTIQLRNWYGVEVVVSVVEGEAVIRNATKNKKKTKVEETTPRYTVPLLMVNIWKRALAV